MNESSSSQGSSIKSPQVSPTNPSLGLKNVIRQRSNSFDKIKEKEKEDEVKLDNFINEKSIASVVDKKSLTDMKNVSIESNRGRIFSKDENS